MSDIFTGRDYAEHAALYRKIFGDVDDRQILAALAGGNAAKQNGVSPISVLGVPGDILDEDECDCTIEVELGPLRYCIIAKTSSLESAAESWAQVFTRVVVPRDQQEAYTHTFILKALLDSRQYEKETTARLFCALVWSLRDHSFGRPLNHARCVISVREDGNWNFNFRLTLEAGMRP